MTSNAKSNSDETRQPKHRWCAGGGLSLLMAALLAACGGGDDTHTMLTGRVTDQGAAVANAEVVLMNRRTDQGFNTQTDDDGFYSITVPNGHYDMASDDGKQQDVKLLGLVSLDGGQVNRDLTLEAGDADGINGRLRLANGEPAAGYVLYIRSMEATRENEAYLEAAETDAQGRFSAQVGGERLFDIDVFDPRGQHMEFIDVHKLDGHLAVDLTLGDESQANLTRHDARPLGAPGGAGVAVAAADGDQTFDIHVSADDNVVLTGGKLTPRPEGTQHNLVLTETQMREAVAGYSGLRPGAGDGEIEIWLEDTDSHWFKRYRVNINVDAVAPGPLTFNYYTFTDETGDSYYLSAYTTGWHDVRFKSDKPNITEVGIGSSFSIDPVVVGLGFLSASAEVESEAAQTFDELLQQAEGLDPELGPRLSAIAEQAEADLENTALEEAANNAANLTEAQKLSALEQSLVDRGYPPDILDPNFDVSELTDEFFESHPEISEESTKHVFGQLQMLDEWAGEGSKNMTRMKKYFVKYMRKSWNAYKALGATDVEATKYCFIEMGPMSITGTESFF